MKLETYAVWRWWQRNGKAVACGSLGWFLGLATAAWLMWKRGLLPLVLAAAIGWQTRAQELFVLTMTPTNLPTAGNGVSLVCGLFYAAVTCAAAAGGVVCVVKIKRAADCIASNQNWKITNAMQEASAMLPTGAVACASMVLVTFSQFEANWALETATTPVGPWTTSATWLALPADVQADVEPRTIVLAEEGSRFFRLKGWR
jgi:hypothetical protein